jgi:hypothetical protein
MAYKLVANTGATTKNPDTALAKNQNLSCASQVIKPPPNANTRPCIRLNQGECQMSFRPNHNHSKGCCQVMGNISGNRNRTR